MNFLEDSLYENVAPFSAYLEETPRDVLLNDYTYSLLFLGNEEERAERFNRLQARLKGGRVSEAQLDNWLASCAKRRNADPDKFFEDVAEAHDKSQKRDLYAPKALEAVETQRVRWLMPEIIPRGEVSVIGGDGGTGKGLYTAQLVAAVTTGRANDFFPEKPTGPRRVLLFSGEDDPSFVLRPRLIAAGADVKQVCFVTPDEYFNETGGILDISSQTFTALIERVSPALVVIDPLQQFLPAGVDMASRNAMRAVVTPLRAAAKRLDFAALLVMHSNKRSSVAGRQRLADSSDLWDLARSVLMLGVAKTDGKVYVSHEKSNYSAPVDTILFTKKSVTVEGVETALAVFDSTTSKKDADFVGEQRIVVSQSKEDASEAILNILAESNTVSMASNALRAAVMKEISCSQRTYERAYSDLIKAGEIKKKPIPNGGKREWFTFLVLGSGNGGEVENFQHTNEKK